jgi:ABC transporter with metal-binding/Fe-S-binding domain ATP-binding protein
MNLGILFSGGKDSTMALNWALQNNYNAPYLITAIPKNQERFLFHTSNVELTELSSKAIGIPLHKVQIQSLEDKEESKELEASIKSLNLNALVAGGVGSNYQAKIFGEVAKNLGLDLYSPYWNKSHEALIREAIQLGFEIIFTSVSADGLTEEWLGRKLDLETLEELKKLSESYGIQIGGEGGEYCTFVTDGPIFKQRIEFIETEKIWKGTAGKLIVKKAGLKSK